jgi:hypothetical protein
MLQISTGMYFDGECYETQHRGVYYTNLHIGHSADVALAVGGLQFPSRRGTLFIEAIDRLPRYDAAGQESWHVATGGTELLDDVASVLSFVTGSYVTSDSTFTDRVLRSEKHPQSSAPGRALRKMRDAEQYLGESELADLKEFMTRLVELERPYFERAMRALRRIVDAAILSESDVTLAYILYVAALESLSSNEKVQPIAWLEYDGKRRTVIDTALAGADQRTADNVRSAVLQIDNLQLRRKFQAFVVSHVEDAYYRTEADAGVRPLRAVDMPNALNFAYQTRSVSLHEVRDLAPEVWRIARDDETVRVGEQFVLTLEGLNRLCRHVLRNYIARSPRGVTDSFDWQAAIPGQVRVELAAEYWAPQWTTFSSADGPRLLSAQVQMLQSTLRGSSAFTDMRAVLSRIEAILPGEAKVDKRRPLIAVYKLWHLFADTAAHQPNAELILKRYGEVLHGPSIERLIVDIFVNQISHWPKDDLAKVAQGRLTDLGRKKVAITLPHQIDAAIQVVLSRALWTAGEKQGALEAARNAVELDPGSGVLMDFENAILSGNCDDQFDVYSYAVGPTVAADVTHP